MSKEDLHKAKLEAKIQSALETNDEVFSAAFVERDAELQPTMVQEKIAEEEREALNATML